MKEYIKNKLKKECPFLTEKDFKLIMDYLITKENDLDNIIYNLKYLNELTKEEE